MRLVVSSVLACAALAISAGAVRGQTFDPRSFQGRGAEPAGQVLVLGTPHLRQAGAAFDAANLEPLLDRLAEFRPDIIAVEQLSGESLYRLKAYATVYPASAETFGARQLRFAALAAAETGLDMPTAEARVRALLAELPAVKTPAQRRTLTAAFAASGDLGSALVQWRRLDAGERRPGEGVSAELAQALDALWAQPNEVWRIGAELAARLGLERLHPVDDHDADDLTPPEVLTILNTAFQTDPAFQAVMADPLIKRLVEATARMTSPEATLDVYREMNTPQMGRDDARLQWLTMLEQPMPAAAGRIRVAEWEARNLRQVAHIREAAASRPGGRVLVIIGASHKPWFDAYLGMMTDLTVADAAAVLGQGEPAP